jgi:hypothetical protein
MRHGQQQPSGVIGRFAAQAVRSSENAEIGASMGVSKVIQYLKFQRRKFVTQQARIADGPAGASEDSNNTRF